MKYKLIATPNENYTVTEQILVNRGIDFKDISHYLRTTDADLHDGKLIDNVAKGIKLLVSHIKNNSKILLQVDSDVDGYTSAAFLLNYLYKMIPGSIHNITYRVHDGKEHGIILDAVINGGYDLVILPDAGSNQYEEHKKLHELGIDVLIIDHHECAGYSENAVIINNQTSEKYPNKSLSGVGMVYKFCDIIDQITNQNIAENYLDLVALGLIADMMDMRNFETRHLISKGLADIRNPFFKGLVERQSFSLGSSVTPIGVAFYIAPLINAVIRVGTNEEKILMFRAMLETDAYLMVPSTKRGHKGEMETVVEQAVRNGINIKNRQKKMRDDGVEKIEEIIKRDKLNDNQVIVVETTAILDKNLTGLVANQLMAKYQKPVLLLRKVPIIEKNDAGEEIVVGETLQGSGRGYDKSEFDDFKGFLSDSKMFEYAEGHANAFGAGIKAEKLDEFMAYSNEMLADYTFDASYNVDFIYNASDVKKQDILDIANMKPLWGKSVEEALIVIKGIKMTNSNTFLLSPDKNPTLKINMQGGITLIKFGFSKELFESLSIPEDGYLTIDILGKCSINEWQGNITPQILIESFEITGSCAYYF